MPILPPSGVPPYDPVELILQFSRIIANDCAISIEGNLLADTQPYVLGMLQLAWRKLCDRLENNSVERFPEEITIYSLPSISPIVQGDPDSKVWINYQGYWDGNELYPTIVLPQGFMTPLRMWERISAGQNMVMIPMWPASSGIPSAPKTTFSRVWEWRDDTIFMPGSMQVNDIKIRFKQQLPDPLLPSPAAPAPLIPLINCAVALAYLTVEIFTDGRGGQASIKFHEEKEDAIKQIVNRTSRKKQFENFRRIPYSRRGRGSNGWRS